MTVCYQVYSSTLTAASVSQQTLTIPKKGRIIAFSMATLFVGGGGGGGVTGITLAKNTNGASVDGINNPQREAVIGRAYTAHGTGAYVYGAAWLTALNIPVNVGDVLNLSSTLTGTAPATGIGYVNVYVEE